MYQPIQGPCNWTAAEIAANPVWIHRFTPQELEEIDAGLRHALAKGRTFETITAADFPLPAVSKVFAQGREQLENGVGMQHYRGIDVTRYTKDQLRLMYWAFGLHLGTPISQSSNGDVLGDVRNQNTDLNGPRGRGYTTNAKLGCHTDSCDVVALFVLRTAREGGLSQLASSVAVHNEMLRLRPDLLAVMYQPFYWSWQGQEPSGAPPYYPQPIFTSWRGKFSCRYVRTHIHSAQRFEEVPRLTPRQAEALELFNQIQADPKFAYSIMFEPGDMQLLNNHVTLHARTEFQDYDEPDRKRHLLRMWLSMPNSRELNPQLGYLYRNLQGGTVRGGFPSHTGKRIFETRLGESVMTD
jgi:hypothetical protein